MNLSHLGWKSSLQKAYEGIEKEGASVGRVALEHKHIYRVYTEQGDILAEISGKMRHEALGREDFPAVGDWVVVSVREQEGKGTIHSILPRFSKFSRKVAGQTTEEQIVAANVDTVLLVMALNHDFNLRRIERYLLLAWESGANPVIVLSKADLCDDVAAKVAEVMAVSPGVDVFAVSATVNTGMDQLMPYVGIGQTVALIGSSGAGKSTIINRLFGKEVQKTGGIREDDSKGKHTTTHRELVVLPDGGLLVDTPGMREIQLWGGEEGISSSFSDVESLAEGCMFQDCRHESEPNCAVKEALENGALAPERFQNYLKLQKELAYQARKEDKALQLAEKQKWKKIHQSVRDRIRR